MFVQKWRDSLFLSKKLDEIITKCHMAAELQ